MSKLCDLGKDIKKKLVDIDKTQEWLIEEVKKDTGLYCDRSYLSKIKVGTLSTPGIVKSICKILDIKQ